MRPTRAGQQTQYGTPHRKCLPRTKSMREYVLNLLICGCYQYSGRTGVSAFLVERNTPGYLPSPHREKMGLRTSPFGGFALVDCFVPEGNRLAREGSGVAIFTFSMEYERSFIFASHVGAMARQLDTCIAYANERQQFGQPIGQFQS